MLCLFSTDLFVLCYYVRFEQSLSILIVFWFILFGSRNFFSDATDTQEENYRAYKLFSMMDVDSGGSISLRELYRVLMGDAIRYILVFCVSGAIYC